VWRVATRLSSRLSAGSITLLEELAMVPAMSRAACTVSRCQSGVGARQPSAAPSPGYCRCGGPDRRASILRRMRKLGLFWMASPMSCALFASPSARMMALFLSCSAFSTCAWRHNSAVGFGGCAGSGHGRAGAHDELSPLRLLLRHLLGLHSSGVLSPERELRQCRRCASAPAARAERDVRRRRAPG